MHLTALSSSDVLRHKFVAAASDLEQRERHRRRARAVGHAQEVHAVHVASLLNPLLRRSCDVDCGSSWCLQEL